MYGAHVIKHDEHDEVLEVSFVCVAYMEQNQKVARRREADYRKDRSRRSRWIARRWRISAAGNEYLGAHDGFNFVIYRKGTNRESPNRTSREWLCAIVKAFLPVRNSPHLRHAWNETQQTLEEQRKLWG